MVLKSREPDVVIPEITFHELILKRIQTYGQDVALVDLSTGREFTFSDVVNDSIKCGSALFKMGLKKGDVVAVAVSNCPEFFPIILGALACGATVTTCNPSYTTTEVKHQFQNSKPKFVFCVPSNAAVMQETSSFVPTLQYIYSIGECKGVKSYASLLKNETGNAFPTVQIDIHEDIAFLPYSSGTTGQPKGVMLTHHNAVSSFSLLMPSLRDDCKYSCLPVFHVAGLYGSLMALYSGTMHVLDNRLDLKRMLSYIEKYKVSSINAVPPILLVLEKSPLLKKYDLSSVKKILCGAAPLSPKIAESLAAKLGCVVAQLWGLTECVPVTAHRFMSPVSSVGSLCPNTKVKVVDVDTGKELGRYQNGEICLKGPQVTKGYFKNPEATRRTIDADGWFHTGDIGYYDKNEMFYIVDRLKELIKYKGFQVAPAELESCLLGHPKINDAAVIGIPDMESGELPKAFIVKKDASLTKKEVHDLINARFIKYKHLHGGIEFCSSIPKTPSGKILRRDLRKKGTNSKI